MENTDPKELLHFIVKALVDHPTEINIKTVEGEKTSIIELKVHNEDIGKVIGEEGVELPWLFVHYYQQ